MFQLLDGPCQENFFVKRAPLFVRAVLDNKTGGKDVLDQLDDAPKESETVYVYKLEGEPGWMHIRGTGKINGFYATGQYRYLPEVDGQSLRDNAKWQAWAWAEFLKQPRAAGSVACPVDMMTCDKEIKACCSCERNPDKKGG